VASFYPVSQVPVVTDVIVPSEWHSSRHHPPARWLTLDERTQHVPSCPRGRPSTDRRTLLIPSLLSSVPCSVTMVSVVAVVPLSAMGQDGISMGRRDVDDGVTFGR